MKHFYFLFDKLIRILKSCSYPDLRAYYVFLEIISPTDISFSLLSNMSVTDVIDENNDLHAEKKKTDAHMSSCIDIYHMRKKVLFFFSFL